MCRSPEEETRAVGSPCGSISWRRTSATACGDVQEPRCSPPSLRCRWRLGIGANTAIYSFMDSILLRVAAGVGPGSLVAMKWRSKPFAPRMAATFVMRSINGSTYRDRCGHHGGHLPVSGVRAPAGSVGAGPVQPLRATNRPAA